MSGTDSDSILSRPRPRCPLCGGGGSPLYSGLKDRLFGAPGTWNLRECTDPACGLIWLDPQPVPEQIHKAYATYYTHEDYQRSAPGRLRLLARDALVLPLRFPFSPVAVSERAVRAYLGSAFGYPAPPGDAYLGMLVDLHPGRRADVDLEVAYLRARAGGELLDVGCGSGNFIRGMKGRGWKVRGVDTDGAAVEAARGAGLDVRQGELHQAEYPSGQFDAVTLIHLIEHVHDPAALLGECQRILRPGGRLVVVTPNTRSWGHRTFGRNYMHLDPPRHLHLFNTRCLRALVEKAGFAVTGASTTVRAANEMFLGSRDIARTGRHMMGGHQPLPARTWARAMQLAEWARLRTDGQCGEEIAILAARRA